MRQLSNLKTNVNIKARILCFTGLLALFFVLIPVTVEGQAGPALKIVELAVPTRYNAVEQNITYFYMVTNSGNVSLTGNINITDNVTGITTLSTDGIDVGSVLTGISIHKITQADIDAGSVTNLAYATGSSNSQPVISSNATATVIYEQPNNSSGPTNEGGLSNNGYGNDIVTIPMYDSPMYSDVSSLYNSAPSSTINVPNSSYQNHSAKISSSKGSNTKLEGSKHKAHLNKHKQKNHTKNHKQKRN